MAKIYDSIPHKIQTFIEEQHMFFVASAPLSAEGHVNLSPKGIDSFRVLSPNRVAYMDLIGSGNETSAHLLENGRITFMFCAFAGRPNILRLYGKGSTVLPGDPDWNKLAGLFTIYPNTRQIITADIAAVQTSCGFGVPLYDYVEERQLLFDWADKKGVDDLAAVKQDHNSVSLDGMPTALGLRAQAEKGR